MKKLIFVISLLLLSSLGHAQDGWDGKKGPAFGLKTNLPYWGTATFNLGGEFRLATRWTVEAEIGVNPFSGRHDDGSYGRSLKHLRVHPEVRYWFCEAFHKSFVGLHVPFLVYNFSDVKVLDLEDERRQGWGTGVGVSYGYQWLLHEHWNLEATFGVGYLYLNYDKFPCKNCGQKQTDLHRHYFGPTQAAVSLIYIF